MCICEEGYSGDACERKDYPLEMGSFFFCLLLLLLLLFQISILTTNTGITEQGHVGGNLWNYYHFSTATSTNVVVRMEEKNPGADCDLYIKRGAEPTKMDFDMRDISFSKEVDIYLFIYLKNSLFCIFKLTFFVFVFVFV